MRTHLYIAAIEIVLYSLAFCQLQMNLGLSQLHSNSFHLCLVLRFFFFFSTFSFAVEAIHGTKSPQFWVCVLSVHNFFEEKKKKVKLELCPINEYAKLKMS